MRRESTVQVRPIREVVDEVMESFGGQATISDVVEALQDAASKREWDTWSDASVRQSVRSALRTKTAGVPDHYEVNGIYKAVRLFSVEDFQDKARSLARLSKANRDRVLELAELCMEMHGRTFDANRVLREERAS